MTRNSISSRNIRNLLRYPHGSTPREAKLPHVIKQKMRQGKSRYGEPKMGRGVHGPAGAPRGTRSTYASHTTTMAQHPGQHCGPTMAYLGTVAMGCLGYRSCAAAGEPGRLAKGLCSYGFLRTRDSIYFKVSEHVISPTNRFISLNNISDA